MGTGRRHLQIQLVVVCDHGMIRSRGWNLRFRGSRIVGVVNKYFPTIVWHLQLIEIKSRQIVHEIAFHLAAEDKNLGPNDIQRMAVSS
jgi:hypothetical protein